MASLKTVRPTSPSPVLELNTLTDRPRIKINGALYEMVTPDEFSLFHYAEHGRKFQRIGTLMATRRPTNQEKKERARLLDEIVRRILVAPDDVHKTLRDAHRMEIVFTFSTLPRKAMTPATGAAPKAARR